MHRITTSTSLRSKVSKEADLGCKIRFCWLLILPCYLLQSVWEVAGDECSVGLSTFEGWSCPRVGISRLRVGSWELGVGTCHCCRYGGGWIVISWFYANFVCRFRICVICESATTCIFNDVIELFRAVAGWSVQRMQLQQTRICRVQANIYWYSPH